MGQLPPKPPPAPLDDRPGAVLRRMVTKIRADLQWKRMTAFNSDCGTFEFILRTMLGTATAATHADRCRCQGDEAAPHKHYREPPFRCARCSDCDGYEPAVPQEVQL